MRIALTGTPGTGKTAIAELLAPELGLELIKLNEFAISNGFVLGHDLDRDSVVLDLERLKKHSWPGDCLIEGHLAHELVVDKVIVLRTHPAELEKRLRKKGWPDRKTDENLEAEAMGLIASEAESGIEINTTGKTAKQVTDEIQAVLSGRAKPESYDFTDWIS